jgi:hypothetical protein
METSVDGYSYLISGFAVYFAAASLFLYVMLALLHVLWILWTRRTSTAWDHISELVVLAQNSRPADVTLCNTAGGISYMRTFGITGRIVVKDGENIELLWTDSTCDEDGAAIEEIRPNELY